MTTTATQPPTIIPSRLAERPTHRACWDAHYLGPAQLIEAPIACQCRDCREAREGGWEGGEGDCLLSSEWEVEYDPHLGLSATRYSESRKNCHGQARIRLDVVGCASRWGIRFVAAVESQLEHAYWHRLWADGCEDVPVDYRIAPIFRVIDNSAEVAAAAESEAFRARRAARVERLEKVG